MQNNRSTEPRYQSQLRGFALPVVMARTTRTKLSLRVTKQTDSQLYALFLKQARRAVSCPGETSTWLSTGGSGRARITCVYKNRLHPVRKTLTELQCQVSCTGTQPRVLFVSSFQNSQKFMRLVETTLCQRDCVEARLRVDVGDDGEDGDDGDDRDDGDDHLSCCKTCRERSP